MTLSTVIMLHPCLHKQTLGSIYTTPMSSQTNLVTPFTVYKLHPYYTAKPCDPIYSPPATPISSKPNRVTPFTVHKLHPCLHSQTAWPHLQSISYTHVFTARPRCPIYSPWAIPMSSQPDRDAPFTVHKLHPCLHSQTVWPHHKLHQCLHSKTAKHHLQSISCTHVFTARPRDPIYSP